MDNITHSLVGITVGEALYKTYSKKTANLTRNNFIIASCIANNFPDLDILYARFQSFDNKHLNYLLQHRGHTHTFVGAIPQLVLLLLLSFFYTKIKKITLSLHDWYWLAATIFLGLCIHIVMDFGNIYGVHPFWPFYNGWIYGDAIFILEPWLWLCLLPSLFWNSQKTGKKIHAALGILALGLVWFSGYVPPLMCTIITIWTIGLFVLNKYFSQKLLLAALSYCFVTGLFCITSMQVKGSLKNLLQAEYPNAKYYDLAISPLPSNPFCWSYFSVRTEAAEYYAEAGIYSAQPKIISSQNCSKAAIKPAMAMLLPQNQQKLFAQRLAFVQFFAPLAELKSLQANHCLAAAFLKFARIPFWHKMNSAIFLGDLRFDHGETHGFASFMFPEQPMNCPKSIPPWPAPRKDMLN